MKSELENEKENVLFIYLFISNGSRNKAIKSNGWLMFMIEENDSQILIFSHPCIIY